MPQVRALREGPARRARRQPVLDETHCDEKTIIQRSDRADRKLSIIAHRLIIGSNGHWRSHRRFEIVRVYLRFVTA